MNSRAIDLRAKKNKRIGIKIIPGHFSTSHSHVNYYIDMTDIKSYYKKAKLAAEELAKAYSSTPVDVIICLEGTRIVGAYLAEELTDQHRRNQSRRQPRCCHSGNQCQQPDDFPG